MGLPAPETVDPRTAEYEATCQMKKFGFVAIAGGGFARDPVAPWSVVRGSSVLIGSHVRGALSN